MKSMGSGWENLKMQLALKGLRNEDGSKDDGSFEKYFSFSFSVLDQR